MKHISLFLFLLSFLILEIANAQLELRFGSRDGRDHRSGRKRGSMDFGVDLGGVKLGLKLSRGDVWSKRRGGFRQHALQSIGNEPGTKVIGYTLISDSGFDYDNVEVVDRDNIDVIKLKVLGDKVRIDRLSIRFCDGRNEVQDFDVNQTVFPNQSTQWVDLQGRNRCISSFSVMGKGDSDGYEGTVVLVGKNLPQNDHRRHRYYNDEYSSNSNSENYPVQSIPATVLPACEFAGTGNHDGYSRRYRIVINRTVMQGTNDLDSILEELEKFRNASVCSPQPKACTLVGSGEFDGYTYTHRIALDGHLIHAADSSDQIFLGLAKLRQAGICL